MTNTDIVLTAMHELFELKDVTALDRYWAEPYTQHNPRVDNGLDGLRKFVPTLGEVSWKPARTVEQGDLVITHSRVLGMYPQPMVIVDIYRLENGRIVEHWDVLQPDIPASETVSGNPMI